MGTQPKDRSPTPMLMGRSLQTCRPSVVAVARRPRNRQDQQATTTPRSPTGNLRLCRRVRRAPHRSQTPQPPLRARVPPTQLPLVNRAAVLAPAQVLVPALAVAVAVAPTLIPKFKPIVKPRYPPRPLPLQPHPAVSPRQLQLRPPPSQPKLKSRPSRKVKDKMDDQGDGEGLVVMADQDGVADRVVETWSIDRPPRGLAPGKMAAWLCARSRSERSGPFRQ